MTKAVWTKFITDSSGAVVEGASVTVFLSDGITPATIFSDPAGTSKANPFLTPAGGKAEFYADPGIYVIQASKDGKTATWNNEEIGHARRDLDLSDLDSAATARTNLGLGTAATKTVTTTPTDTTAGRLLKVGDFGVGGMPLVSETALNAAPFLNTGWFLTAAANQLSDLPPAIASSSSRLIVSVEGGSTSYIKQTIVVADASPIRQFFRANSATILAAGGVAWREIYHTDNIIGTVSQSGGVPTGAVIERGSNVSGEYVKFADGTLICWLVYGLTSNSGAVTWVFPHAFSASSSITLTSDDGVPRIITSQAAGHTQVEVNGFDISGARAVFGYRAISIGRWY